jgi:fructosamine-3-kinase
MVHERSDGWHLSGLLDPVGLRYAEVEKELAYMEAFDTVGQMFFDVYTSRCPLRPGYRFRRLFYWLDTYMLHLWLGFGREMQDRIVATTREVLASDPTSL